MIRARVMLAVVRWVSFTICWCWMRRTATSSGLIPRCSATSPG